MKTIMSLALVQLNLHCNRILDWTLYNITTNLPKYQDSNHKENVYKPIIL